MLALSASAALAALATFAAGCAVPQHYVLGDGGGLDAAPGEGGREGGAAEGGAGDGGGMDAADVTEWPPSAGGLAVICALSASCPAVFGDFPYTNLSACVDNGINTFFGLRYGDEPEQDVAIIIKALNECALTSYSCQSASDCLAAGGDRARCAGGAGGYFCVGDDLSVCGANGTLITFHCPDWNGQHCREIDGDAFCTTGSPCDSNAPDYCDGDNYVHCSGLYSLEIETPCGQAFPGTGCQVLPPDDAGNSGGARCVPLGPPCAQANPHCEGTDVLVECDPRTHREVRTDCSVLFGTQCEVQGATAQCSTGTECSSADPDTCATSTAVGLCVNGKRARVNCGSIGLQGCELDPQVTTLAHCF